MIRWLITITVLTSLTLCFSCDEEVTEPVEEKGIDPTNLVNYQGYWYHEQFQGMLIQSDKTVQFFRVDKVDDTFQDTFYEIPVKSELLTSDSAYYFALTNCGGSIQDGVYALKVLDSMSLLMNNSLLSEAVIWKKVEPIISPHSLSQRSEFSYEIINEGGHKSLSGLYSSVDDPIFDSSDCQIREANDMQTLSLNMTNVEYVCMTESVSRSLNIDLEDYSSEKYVYYVNDTTSNSVVFWETNPLEGFPTSLESGALEINGVTNENSCELSFSGWFLVGELDTLYIKNGYFGLRE